jgi:hypothetical protein
VREDAPPGRSGALTDAGRTVGRAAFGGTLASIALIVICQLLAVVQFLLVGAYGLWSWVKIGILTALLSLRADMLATVQGPPIPLTAAGSSTLHVRFVPLVLTIGFLWLAARAGRRAVRPGRGPSPLVTAGLAAAGAGVPVAGLSAVCSTLVNLFFPALGLRLQVDMATAALWGGLLAAAGAGAGAYLEAARGRASAGALGGGLTAYGWALGLLAVGVFVVATLEPTVTRRYVDGVTGLGTGGGVLLGYHLLAFPAQSALLLPPASGSCLDIVGEGSIYGLCPWRLIGSGPAGGLLLLTPLELSPWFWLLNAVPFVAAMLGGRRAVTGAPPTTGGGAAGLGVAAGSIFALLTVVGAWFVAPRWFPASQVNSVVIPLSHVSVHPEWIRTAITALVWGVGGGGLGAWFATGRYAEPGLPRPTSA